MNTPTPHPSMSTDPQVRDTWEYDMNEGTRDDRPKRLRRVPANIDAYDDDAGGTTILAAVDDALLDAARTSGSLLTLERRLRQYRMLISREHHDAGRWRRAQLNARDAAGALDACPWCAALGSAQHDADEWDGDDARRVFRCANDACALDTYTVHYSATEVEAQSDTRNPND